MLFKVATLDCAFANGSQEMRCLWNLQWPSADTPLLLWGASMEPFGRTRICTMDRRIFDSLTPTLHNSGSKGTAEVFSVRKQSTAAWCSIHVQNWMLTVKGCFVYELRMSDKLTFNLSRLDLQSNTICFWKSWSSGSSRLKPTWTTMPHICLMLTT